MFNFLTWIPIQLTPNCLERSLHLTEIIVRLSIWLLCIKLDRPDHDWHYGGVIIKLEIKPAWIFALNIAQ